MNNHTHIQEKNITDVRVTSKLTRRNMEGCVVLIAGRTRKGAELTKFTNVNVYYVH